MNSRAVINVVSALIAIIGLTILTSTPVSIWMNDSIKDTQMLSISGVIAIVLGTFGYYLSKGEKYNLGVREGFGIVTIGWIAASIFGAIPYMLVSHIHWYDAIFETMSGFTTTGSSVLQAGLDLTNGTQLKEGIADLPCGLLYWRAMTHWLGGMGIVVLSLAILPFLGIGGQQLYNAEVPGPTSDQLTPKIASSAKILWSVYFLMTIVETLLLWAGPMTLFEAWCHTCATLATGGFSTSQGSVAGFSSAYVDYIITIFMFLAGCNFVLHYRALLGKPLFYFKDEEFRFYLGITAVATAVITFSVYGGQIMTTAGATIENVGIADAFRYSVFQVVSIMTTTGFCTADFDLWPVYSALILLGLMFIGGCGGSTGGGIKVSRIILALKYSISQIQRCLFPRQISNIRLNKERIDTGTLHKVVTFIVIFVGLFIAFAFILTLFKYKGENIDLLTSLSASVASLGNIGPGISKVGASCTYYWMPPAAKVILSFAMLLGRLEIYTVLVIFLPSFWKK